MTAFMVITCLISIGGKNTAYAAAMENIKVTDVDISTDGHMRGLKWGWTTSGYASASCKLGIQSEKFTTGDLTNFGDYLSSHRYSGWASAESPEGCGFKGWITENSFSRSSGTYDRTDTISGEGIDMGTTGVYYLYMWTYYNGYVFPDIYIGSIDLNAGKIVDASGVDKSWGVLEIGPGIGVLTKELAQRAAKVVSIEVDERLPPLLAETMAGVDNFKLVLQDVLKVDLRALIEEEFPGMPVAVCANLPYYITSPIVMKLLGDRLPIQNLTVMVQKEAADRLAAAPGTRASSAISCAVSYYATSKLMFTAAPGSFYPAPKVTSAVVRMDIRLTPAVQVEDEDGYFALIRAAFGQRRKTAANAIASGLGLPKDKVIAAIEAAGFDARIRPEALTLEDFAAVQRELK